MQSPSASGASSLPKATELALLRVLAEANDFNKFGNIVKEKRHLFGSARSDATAKERRSSDAVYNRRRYLIRNPATFVAILQRRNILVHRKKSTRV
jgi:hypothetical protein